MDLVAPGDGYLRILIREGNPVAVGQKIGELCTEVRPHTPPPRGLIAPSILAGDFANLQKEVEMLNQSEADWIHVDIMDGVFVPNLSFGLPVCEALYRYAQKPMDVHLMIVQPEKYLAAFQKAGAQTLTVHYEACPHLHRTIYEIKALGMRAGVALNPHTPVELLSDILPDLDLVCLMSVNPGFGGQSFIPATFGKLLKLKNLRQAIHSQAQIEIDGGVDASNAAALFQAGADVLVAGSSVFKAPLPSEAIRALKFG
ncbi:MAG: ribulose-phosphate 3-epimerase [Microscillaceae bacterium]|nr:ribulose-phosphate 3-epimerase [Microscillaceae bacterium]